MEAELWASESGSPSYIIGTIYYYYFFFEALGFELRASHLLGKLSYHLSRSASPIKA
jgi:hypothetical protein